MPSVERSSPTSLTNVNGTLFFSANNGVNGYELWKSEGTPGGTKLVKDIRSGFQVSSSPANLRNKNGVLVFSAVHASGRELWRSDGSQSGTLLIKDIRPGAGSSNPSQLTVVDSAVYFAAYDGVHGLELWKSDGTIAGTVLLQDLTPGPGSATNYAASHLSELTAINHKLYFIATTPGPSIYEATQSLWVSDGTDEGTRRLTLYPEISFSFIAAYPVEFKGAPYFVASSNESLDMWRTTGTAQSTNRVLENISESFSAYTQLTRVSGYIYFVGHRTLNRTDGTPAGTISISRIESTNAAEALSASGTQADNANISAFPSPFSTDFSLNIIGVTGVRASIDVINSHVEKIESHALNLDHGYSFGAGWLPGLYIINVTTDSGIIRKRIRKK